jgi:CRP-like cAMP-binding protein
MSPQMKKLEILLDDLQIIAKCNTTLAYTEANLLHGLLVKYPELVGPLTKILDTPIEGYLAAIPFLVDVKESKLSVLAAMCRYESYDKDEVIFEENTTGTNLYIILYGSVQVMSPKCVDNSSLLGRSLEWGRDENNQYMAILKEGDYFGETTLFTSMPRTCTVVSINKTLLVTVEHQIFKNFLSICPVGDEMYHVMKERIFSKLSRLRIPLLDGIPLERLQNLSQSASLEELERGAEIFHEGDAGDNFYIIVYGEVKVETSEQNESSECIKVLGYLGPGKYFGEMALVTDSPRTATVTAMSKTLLLCVNKDSFLSIFSTKQAMAEFQLRLLRHGADLKHILMHTKGMEAFRTFLEKRLAQENIEFWAAVKELQNIIDEEDIKAQSLKIFRTYCDEGSEKQVNLPYTIRNFIQAELLEKKRYDASLFDSAQNEIYELMKNDHFTKFKKTTEYSDVFNCLGILL